MAMTTNLEWLYENDRDALIAMVSSNMCEDCVALRECKGGDVLSYGGCLSFRKNWLEAEYVEPDSWEKIEYDAIGIAQVLNESYFCPADITNAVVNLVLRCEKLTGAE